MMGNTPYLANTFEHTLNSIMKTKALKIGSLSSLLLFGFFLSLGIMNIWFKNIAIGAIYIALSVWYLPGTDAGLKQLFHISIPRGLKFVIALLAIWSSIVVGNLLSFLKYWF